jgi:hypothetical protein
MLIYEVASEPTLSCGAAYNHDRAAIVIGRTAHTSMHTDAASADYLIIVAFDILGGNF